MLTRTIKSGGLNRSYLLNVPTGHDGSLIVNFHGALSNGTAQALWTDLHTVAAKQRTAVAYPNGTGWYSTALYWNAGGCCSLADDIAFVVAMLGDIAKVTKVDTKRLYATGISNGGMMAYHCATHLNDVFAAIAPVAGPLGTAPSTVALKLPVSVMHCHGDADKHAPIGGGRGDLSPYVFYSVADTLAAFVKQDRCPAAPREVADLADNYKDGTTVRRTTWAPGAEGSEVVFYLIRGGGHTWPGRPVPTTPGLNLGLATKEIDANQLMCDFFAKHARS